MGMNRAGMDVEEGSVEALSQQFQQQAEILELMQQQIRALTDSLFALQKSHKNLGLTLKQAIREANERVVSGITVSALARVSNKPMIKGLSGVHKYIDEKGNFSSLEIWMTAYDYQAFKDMLKEPINTKFGFTPEREFLNFDKNDAQIELSYLSASHFKFQLRADKSRQAEVLLRMLTELADISMVPQVFHDISNKNAVLSPEQITHRFPLGTAALAIKIDKYLGKPAKGLKEVHKNVDGKGMFQSVSLVFDSAENERKFADYLELHLNTVGLGLVGVMKSHGNGDIRVSVESKWMNSPVDLAMQRADHRGQPYLDALSSLVDISGVAQSFRHWLTREILTDDEITALRERHRTAASCGVDTFGVFSDSSASVAQEGLKNMLERSGPGV